MRALAEAAGGALCIVGFAAFWLWFMPPAHAAALRCNAGTIAASWYGKETCRYNPDKRCPTAGGVMHFDGSQLLAAHRTLPMHTRIRVTFKGKSIVVPVLDRGPAKWTGKSLDLSKAAAFRIGLTGTGCVKMEVLR